MWEETVPFDEDTLISDETERDDFVHCKRSDFKYLKDETERDDFVHCKRSDFKYLIYHVTGYTYNFTQERNMNYENAVS